MSNKGPCLGCGDRHIDCHSSCIKYKDWQQEWQKQKDIEYGNRCKDKFLARYVRDRHMKDRQYRAY